MSSDLGYRPMARGALDRARKELSSGDKERLKYAALNLREAMEALTYGRAHAFRDMLPPSAIVQHWQPRKLLEELLRIDPQADQTRTLYMLAELGDGKEKEVVEVGTENVLSLKTIKKNYDALGHYLHLPTISELQSGDGHDFVRLRERCEAVAVEVERALSSTMFNMVFGRDMEIHCARCRSSFTTKLPWGEFSYVTDCRNCSAPYHVRSKDGERVEFRPLRSAIKCQGTKDCDGTHDLWNDEVKAETSWACSVCGTTHRIDLVIRCPDAAGWNKVEIGPTG